MRITYIGHSGFLAETDRKYLLFDYYKGYIPPMKEDKPLYVFVSHAHGDHFNPSIFLLAEKHPKIIYILSYDIKLKPWNLERWKVTAEIYEKIVSVRANQKYEIEDICVTTYKSTDEGVAFLLETEGRSIYHAGDLNWWFWEGESKQWNNNMTASFKREIEKMTGMSIDLAFLPLDPRQEKYYYLGFEYILKNVKINHAIPMHMWGDYTVADRIKADGYLNECDTEVSKITEEGQEINLWGNEEGESGREYQKDLCMINNVSGALHANRAKNP